MLERSIIFIILGVFVFTPAASSWWSQSYFSWYNVYLPWVSLIAATLWIHLQASRSGRAVMPPEHHLEPGEQGKDTRTSKHYTAD